MGGGLSKVIKDVDGSAGAEKEVKEALDALYELGKSRTETAWSQATSNAINVYAPINQVLLRRQSIIASASTDPSAIVDGIKGAVDKLVSGQIMDGIAEILKSALKAVLGEASGQVASSYTYALIATELGALLRVDIDIYSFEIRSQGIMNKAKNMTAVTTLVSSIKLDALKLNDLRAIVSMTFGGSPAETQQNILKVIIAAYEEDKKANSKELSDEARERVRSLFVPSAYEAEWKKWKAKQRGPNGLPIDEDDHDSVAAVAAKEKISRADLLAALKEHQEAALASSVGALDVNGDVPGGADPKKTGWTEVFLWMKLITQVEIDWLTRMSAMITGFNIPDMFLFDRVVGGNSGSAITFRCTVNSEHKLFDKVMRYIEDEIFVCINHSQYLSEHHIQTMALQYRHPSEDDSDLVSTVHFKQNTLENTTDDDVIFTLAKTTAKLPTLKSKENMVLSGTVHHISKPVAEGSEEVPAQWVTYQRIPRSDIIVGQRAVLSALPGGGYRITMHTANDRVLHIDYNEAWTD